MTGTAGQVIETHSFEDLMGFGGGMGTDPGIHNGEVAVPFNAPPESHMDPPDPQVIGRPGPPQKHQSGGAKTGVMAGHGSSGPVRPDQQGISGAGSGVDKDAYIGPPTESDIERQRRLDGSDRMTNVASAQQNDPGNQYAGMPGAIAPTAEPIKRK